MKYLYILSCQQCQLLIQRNIPLFGSLTINSHSKINSRLWCVLMCCRITLHWIPHVLAPNRSNDPEYVLYQLPEHLKVESTVLKTEDMLSNQMLSGIPEVDLGIAWVTFGSDFDCGKKHSVLEWGSFNYLLLLPKLYHCVDVCLSLYEAKKYIEIGVVYFTNQGFVFMSSLLVFATFVGICRVLLSTFAYVQKIIQILMSFVYGIDEHSN